MSTTIDQALAERDRRVAVAKEMEKSLMQKEKPIEGDHIFDVERKKMSEDTHNKV